MPKTVLPPPPYNCRHPPPDPLKPWIKEDFDDELSKRQSLHNVLDSAFAGLTPPGTTGTPVPPSRLLYRSFHDRPRTAAAWEAELLAWQSRWKAASKMDDLWRHSRMAQALTAMELPLLCRTRPGGKLQSVPAAIGRAVHKLISNRYLASVPNTVVCDNVVHFRDRSPSVWLSKLAANDRNSVYGALNYSLAGQRNDIVDLDTGEMWEIKPVNLTRRNLMQLWGYIDNYEVGRAIRFYSGDPDPPIMRPGDITHLPSVVTTPFELLLTDEVALIIHTVTDPKLPGIIGYYIKEKVRKRPDEVAAKRALLYLNANVQAVLASARQKDLEAALEQLRKDEELAEEVRRLVIYLAVTALVAVTGFYVLKGVALLLGIAGSAGAGVTGGALATGGAAAVPLLKGAGGVAATSNVVELFAVRGVASVAIEQMAAQATKAVAVDGLAKIAAGVGGLYIAGQQFGVPDEIVPMCLEAACEVGFSSLPELPR
jgi:hypothetical protein